LNIELAWLDDVVRAKRQRRIPVVLSRRIRLLYKSDLAGGYSGASMPPALSRKYPNAAYEFAWQEAK